MHIISKFLCVLEAQVPASSASVEQVAVLRSPVADLLVLNLAQRCNSPARSSAFLTAQEHPWRPNSDPPRGT